MATQHDATFYRAALLLGLVPGEHVVAWADQVIHHEPHPPLEIYVVAMTPVGDLTRLRDALLPLAEETESPEVVRELLGIVARDLADGRRNVEDNAVPTQTRRLLPVPADWSAPSTRSSTTTCSPRPVSLEIWTRSARGLARGPHGSPARNERRPNRRASLSPPPSGYIWCCSTTRFRQVSSSLESHAARNSTCGAGPRT